MSWSPIYKPPLINERIAAAAAAAATAAPAGLASSIHLNVL